MKNVVCAVRSSSAIPSVAISTGAASTISADVVSTPQTKIGSRVHVRHGARMGTIVAIMLSPSSVIEMPTSAKKMIEQAIPGYDGKVRGAYPVQPVEKPPKQE